MFWGRNAQFFCTLYLFIGQLHEDEDAIFQESLIIRVHEIGRGFLPFEKTSKSSNGQIHKIQVHSKWLFHGPFTVTNATWTKIILFEEIWNVGVPSSISEWVIISWLIKNLESHSFCHIFQSKHYPRGSCWFDNSGHIPSQGAIYKKWYVIALTKAWSVSCLSGMKMKGSNMKNRIRTGKSLMRV